MPTGKENLEYVKKLYGIFFYEPRLRTYPHNLHKKIFKFLIGFLKTKGKTPDEIQSIYIIDNETDNDILIKIYWKDNTVSFIPYVNLFGQGRVVLNLDTLTYKNKRFESYPTHYDKENIIMMLEYLRYLLINRTDEGFDFKKYMASNEDVFWSYYYKYKHLDNFNPFENKK